jgi:hypothetical protein
MEIKYCKYNRSLSEFLTDEELSLLMELLSNNTPYPGSIEWQIREKLLYISR